MKFVRHLKAQPGYDPATRHVVYGQDADLLLLALLCHEPYFKVMREDMQGGEVRLFTCFLKVRYVHQHPGKVKLDDQVPAHCITAAAGAAVP